MQIQSTQAIKVSSHCLIYGAAKIGKTYLMTTAPNPLIADADDGLSSIRAFNLPYCSIDTHAKFLEFVEWVIGSKEARQFQTFFLDDLTEVAERYLVEEKPRHKNLMQAYGQLNDMMMEVVRRLRKIEHGTIVMNCKQDKIKDELTGGMIYSPMIPGKAVQPMLPYLVGEVYHLEDWINPQDQSVHKVLRTKRDPRNQYEAGSRSGKLAELEFANLSAIFQKVNS